MTHMTTTTITDGMLLHHEGVDYVTSLVVPRTGEVHLRKVTLVNGNVVPGENLWKASPTVVVHIDDLPGYEFAVAPERPNYLAEARARRAALKG